MNTILFIIYDIINVINTIVVDAIRNSIEKAPYLVIVSGIILLALIIYIIIEMIRGKSIKKRRSVRPFLIDKY